MCVSWQHVYRLNLIPAYLKLKYLIRTNLPLLNKAMPRYHYKKLPFMVMPMLPLCHPWLANIDTELAMINRFQQFRKTAAAITTRMKVKNNFFFW